MTIKEAIEKAIEGGWKKMELLNGIELPSSIEIKDSLLDPLFWQSLGKAMGLGNKQKEYMLRGEVEIKRYYIKPEVETREHVNRDIEENRMKYEVEKAILAIESQDWLYHWHLFIDHLSKGKDIESFFERL